MKCPKICECCQNTLRTREYLFYKRGDTHKVWKRDWCKKCFKKWYEKNRYSLETGMVYLKQSWLERLWRRWRRKKIK